MRLTKKEKQIDCDYIAYVEYLGIVEKLGQLEDILEGHNIEELDELDGLLWYIKRIKDIEKELGIDFITLFKASKGIVVYNESKTAIQIDVIPTIDLFNKRFIVYTGNILKPYKTLYFKDCGKTWTLTKEELE